MTDNDPIKQNIVRKTETIGLIGGSEIGNNDFSDLFQHAPILIAADGGANAAVARGYLPDVVIGDLDSLSDAARRVIPAAQLHRIDDQNTTDLEKCLGLIRARLILGIGFLGGRLDHHLAACAAIADPAAPRCLLLGAEDVVFAARGTVALDLVPGTRVSLFPMARVQGRATGLRWSIEGLEFATGNRTGISNAATGPVTLTFDTPGMLVILPRSTLSIVVAALLVQATGDVPGTECITPPPS
jgi:thiamine pyrophosphokinase